jgi:Flp pilus assembly pilin Flp
MSKKSTTQSPAIEKAPTETLSLLRDERGLTTVEYIIILCLIAVAGFAIWKQFGQTVKTRVGEADTTLGSGMTGVGE